MHEWLQRLSVQHIYMSILTLTKGGSFLSDWYDKTLDFGEGIQPILQFDPASFIP